MIFETPAHLTAALAAAVSEVTGLKVEALSSVSCSAYVGGVRFSDHSDFVQRGERETIRVDGLFEKVYRDDGDGTFVTEGEYEDLSRGERECMDYAGVQIDPETFASLVAKGVAIA